MVSVNLLFLLSNVIILTFAKLTPIQSPKNAMQFVHMHLKNSVVNMLIINGRYYHDLSETIDHFPFYIVRTQTDQYLGDFKEEPQNYIIAVDNLTDILAENLPGTATYFVIVNDIGLVPNTAETLWKFRLPYSFIISTDTGLIYHLKIEDCGSKVSPKQINDLKTISKWDMRADFSTCPLYVIWALMPPFVNDLNSSHQGIFIELVKTLSMYNRKIIFRPTDPVYLEQISLSYSFEAIIEDLVNEYAQIFVGPTADQTMSILHVSPILTDNSLQFLTPRPINRLWEMIFSWPMLRMTCFTVAIQLSVVFTFYYLAKYTADRFIFSSIAKTHYLLAGFILSIPTLYRLPRTRHLQVYLGVCLLQFMVISIYIQGSFVSSLSGALYGKPIESLEALLESNVPIKLIKGLSFLFSFGRNDEDREVYRRFEELPNLINPFQAGNVAVRTRDFATIVDNGYLIMRPNILKSFSAFEFFNYKQMLGMPKRAYFVNEYNEWIFNVIEIGIVSKFTKLYEHFYALRYFVEEDKRNFVLTFHQIQPVLILASIGFSISFAVFLVEILVAKGQLLFYRRQFTN